MNDISFFSYPVLPRDFELIERKGIGHPDTLADELAEALSRNYSNYTLHKFGAILHHNFDKVCLLGGKAFVSFGKGHLTSPIRVLVNGRVSTSFGSIKISYKKLITNTVYSFFHEHFGDLVKATDLEIHYNLSNASSPGKTEEKDAENGKRKYWFEPRDLNDLPELKSLFSNDTSLGCGYSPYTSLEQVVLEIEGTLNSRKYKKTHPWCGSDIKIMASRIKDNIDITFCLPQISSYVFSLLEYKENINIAFEDALAIVKKYFSDRRISLHINTRDNFKTSELYLTAIGSSIESGDEGVVGRGNRVNGLISILQPMSMEGACGKNPVYHVGKLYNIVASRIANKIFQQTKQPARVFLVSQSGTQLTRPWKTIMSNRSL